MRRLVSWVLVIVGVACGFVTVLGWVTDTDTWPLGLLAMILTMSGALMVIVPTRGESPGNS